MPTVSETTGTFANGSAAGPFATDWPGVIVCVSLTMGTRTRRGATERPGTIECPGTIDLPLGRKVVEGNEVGRAEIGERAWTRGTRKMGTGRLGTASDGSVPGRTVGMDVVRSASTAGEAYMSRRTNRLSPAHQ